MGISVTDISRMGPAAQRQILDKLRAGASKAPPPTGKYHNVKAVRVMPNGEEHVFDSQKEARRYDELMALLRAGQIRELKLQPQYTLQESYITAEGDRVRAIRYVADFAYQKKICNRQDDPSASCADTSLYTREALRRVLYQDTQGDIWLDVVEDVKSKATETRVYKVKKKLMQERFGISIKEV